MKEVIVNNIKRHQPYKVAFFIGSLNPGGSERHIIRLIEGLTHYDYKVSLIVNSKSGKLLSKISDLKVDFIEIPIYPTILGRLMFISNSAKYLRVRRLNTIQTFNDILLLYVFIAAKLSGTQNILFGLRNTHLLSEPTLKNKIIGILCRKMISGVIANSKITARQARTAFCIPENKIKIVYNGVEDFKERKLRNSIQIKRKIGLNPKLTTIGIVARLDPIKRIDILIKATSLLLDLPIQVVVIGDGQERNKLLNEIKLTGQSERFQILGNKSDPLKWMRAFDVGVLCSESEGLPQVVLEYMAVGLPVIATNVGGMPELVVHGKTGLLVSPNNPKTLANALQKVIMDKGLRIRMGKAGEKRAKELFSLKQEILLHMNAYQSLLSRE